MIRAARYWLASVRWRRFTKHFDAQIEAARADHARVAHLKAAKQAFLHDALRGSR